MVRPVRRGQTQAQVLLMHGVRSGLEERICKDLTAQGIEYEYEKHKLKYTSPETLHTYTPDIVLPNGLIIELKGRFTAADRKKMNLVKKAHPGLDIRMVFSNSRSKISKASKTTYGDWCDKHGFPYADKNIPEEWIR